MRLLTRFIHFLLGVTIVVALGGAGAMLVAKRMRSGAWLMPNRSDLVWVTSFFGREAEPSRVIYLDRDGMVVTGGVEYGPTGRSGILARGRRLSTPGFNGSERAWRTIVGCVRNRFDAYDVAVTDERPPRDGGYVTVAVGGRPGDVGLRHRRVSGLAPFNGHVIPDSLVFAFSEQMGNRPREVCETIAHEVGHVYGLDHAHRCSDLMTHFRGCGIKRFRDVDALCGEDEPRACEGGESTQNSHRRLLDVLGPARRKIPRS